MPRQHLTADISHGYQQIGGLSAEWVAGYCQGIRDAAKLCDEASADAMAYEFGEFLLGLLPPKERP